MLTLTYPGDWLTVAPDGDTVKRHFTALAKRYERAWGEPLVCIWKLEFQDRGAPHFHISTTPPMGFTPITDPHTGEQLQADFKTWLSLTWAEIVAHPDPEQRRRHRAAGTGVDYAEGIKLTDPRRIAVYFAKYGTGGRKDYHQHRVPREWLPVALVCGDCGREYDADLDECPECGCLDAELAETGAGPGRCWGYRGLHFVLAARQVTPAVGIAAGRLLRRWYRAKGLTKTVLVERVDQATGRVYLVARGSDDGSSRTAVASSASTTARASHPNSPATSGPSEPRSSARARTCRCTASASRRSRHRRRVPAGARRPDPSGRHQHGNQGDTPGGRRSDLLCGRVRVVRRRPLLTALRRTLRCATAVSRCRALISDIGRRPAYVLERG
jgi:hypothetical protein